MVHEWYKVLHNWPNSGAIDISVETEEQMPCGEPVCQLWLFLHVQYLRFRHIYHFCYIKWKKKMQSVQATENLHTVILSWRWSLIFHPKACVNNDLKKSVWNNKRLYKKYWGGKRTNLHIIDKNSLDTPSQQHQQLWQLLQP